MPEIVDDAVKAVQKFPPWVVPVALGGALGLFTLWRKRQAPATAAPVAVAVPPTPQKAQGLAGADFGDVQGLLADQNRRNEERNKALEDAFRKGLDDITKQLNPPVVPGGPVPEPGLPGDVPPREPPGGSLPPREPGGGSPLLPPPTNPTPTLPGPSPVAPALPPPPKPVSPGPVYPPTPNPNPPPAPAPAPAPSGGKPTSEDWAALAYFLGGKSFSPGGLHYAGENQQINWNAPPYSSQEPPPPTGVYPSAPLPVNFNGGHAGGRYPYGINPYSESAYVRTLRWTANYMQGNPNANPATVWDGMLGRLMRDLGPIRGSNWFDTGFDLGSVKNSPFLDGDGTPNPAWQDIY